MRQKGLNIRLVDYLRVGSVRSILEVLSASLILLAEVNMLHFALATRLILNDEWACPCILCRIMFFRRDDA